MLTNKWVQFGLSLLITIAGFAATFDWTQLVTVEHAGAIVSGVGIIKMILNAIAPAAGQTVVPTGGSVITHTAK